MARIHQEQSAQMFHKAREDNKKFLEEFHNSYKLGSDDKKSENKEEKK